MTQPAHMPTPLEYDDGLTIISGLETIACLTDDDGNHYASSREVAEANAAYIVKAVNCHEEIMAENVRLQTHSLGLDIRKNELIASLKEAKRTHYECEDDPHFSCLKSESSRSYYDDPQCRKPTEIVCTCGADEHNSRIDLALAKAGAA